jgi:hypothetical protein
MVRFIWIKLTQSSLATFIRVKLTHPLVVSFMCVGLRIPKVAGKVHCAALTFSAADVIRF